MITPIYLCRGAFSHYRRYISQSTHDPLKIAFFGSDNFSVASLNKLIQYQKKNPDKVDSVHVITRSLKPQGRYMKTVQDLPVGKFSSQQGLSIMRADTSQEIRQLSEQYLFNLVIAVSYGRLIPSTFIQHCKYGGLNVHPSLLPKYSGSSPLQYALLNDDKFTGCTVQTLHPTKFDHGDIIIQSSEILILDDDNSVSLFKKFGEIGGDLLVKSIDQGLFVNPTPIENNYTRSMAPKIPKAKLQVFWNKYLAREIKRLYDALGPIFTFLNVNVIRKRKQICEKQRVILSCVKEYQLTDSFEQLKEPGDFMLVEEGLLVKAKKGGVLVERIKMQAQEEESPEKFIGTYSKKVGPDMPKHFIN